MVRGVASAYLGLLLAGAAVGEEFSDSAKFERWSHFKDYGVPAVMGKDAVNSAAIADASCRLIQQRDGFFFWHYPDRVQRVLKALADAPPTSNPSFFTLTVMKTLTDACADKNDKLSPPDYDFKSLAGSVQNWYHALAAHESDPSWQGKFDPAYQPQQVALTTGLICMVACDVNGRQLSANAMSGLASVEASAMRKLVSTKFPWVEGNTMFSKASSVQELASLTRPFLSEPCGCSIDQQRILL